MRLGVKLGIISQPTLIFNMDFNFCIFILIDLRNMILGHDFFRVCVVLNVKVLQIVRLLQLSFRNKDFEIVDTYACRSKYGEYQNERCSRNRGTFIFGCYRSCFRRCRLGCRGRCSCCSESVVFDKRGKVAFIDLFKRYTLSLEFCLSMTM